MTIDKGSAGDTPHQVDPDLGVMRTMMAADRTLMAWIRTSLSMFTFGYSLYKILQELNDIAKPSFTRAPHETSGLCLR